MPLERAAPRPESYRCSAFRDESHRRAAPWQTPARGGGAAFRSYAAADAPMAAAAAPPPLRLVVRAALVVARADTASQFSSCVLGEAAAHRSGYASRETPPEASHKRRK